MTPERQKWWDSLPQRERSDNMAKVKNVNCKCSVACRTWFCCQDCDLKTSCKNPCENAFNTKLCEHFEK